MLHSQLYMVIKYNKNHETQTCDSRSSITHSLKNMQAKRNVKNYETARKNKFNLWNSPGDVTSSLVHGPQNCSCIFPLWWQSWMNLPSATPHGYWRPLTFLPFTSTTTLLPTTASGIFSCSVKREVLLWTGKLTNYTSPFSCKYEWDHFYFIIEIHTIDTFWLCDENTTLFHCNRWMHNILYNNVKSIYWLIQTSWDGISM